MSAAREHCKCRSWIDKRRGAAGFRAWLLASSSGSDVSHAVKKRRVHEMIAQLEACKANGQAICERP